MGWKATVEELARLEESLWRRETRFDRRWMEELLAPDCWEIGRSGRVYDRDALLEVPDREIDAVLPLPELQVRLLQPDLAQVTYLSVVRQPTGTQRAHRSSLWTRADGRWQLRFHQGTAHSDDALRTWTRVDAYFEAALAPGDPDLASALRHSEAAGLPPHQVSAAQGKLLHLLAGLRGARRILEIGTLGGYSTLWLARALPEDGRLVSLEADATHVEVARANLERAGLASRVEVRAGSAVESLRALVEEGAAPFDLVFLDADKPNNPTYLEWTLRLSRSGTVIFADNVVRDGEVASPDSTDPRVLGVRRFVEMLAADPRLDATAIQTVGSKGFDGFALAVVR